MPPENLAHHEARDNSLKGTVSTDTALNFVLATTATIACILGVSATMEEAYITSGIAGVVAVSATLTMLFFNK